MISMPSRVPPVGTGEIVNVCVTSRVEVATATNSALQLRGAVISVRPAGAQSPTYFPNAKPASGLGINSAISPSGLLVAHSFPSVPQLIPGPEIVPFTGLATVKSTPEGPAVKNQTATATTPTARTSAPVAMMGIE